MLKTTYMSQRAQDWHCRHSHACLGACPMWYPYKVPVLSTNSTLTGDFLCSVGVTNAPIDLVLRPELSLQKQLHLAHFVLHVPRLLTGDVFDWHQGVALVSTIPLFRWQSEIEIGLLDSLNEHPHVIPSTIAPGPWSLWIRLPVS